MTKTRFTPWIVLACMGAVAACTSGDDGTPAGNTEINVIVPTNAGTPDEIDVQTVEYTITCLGNDDTFLDNNASFDDEVRIDGNLEVVDGRTSYGAGRACNGGDNNGATCYAYRCNGGDPGVDGAPCTTPASPSLECQGTSPTPDGNCEPTTNASECPGTSPTPDGSCDVIADFGPDLQNRSEIWQGFTDLSPGPCNIQLRARDNKGEVICTTDQGFVITADVTTKVNLVLMCMTSFQAPIGSLDVDATFSFNVGNFCPDQFVFNCTNSNPDPAPRLPPPNPEIAATSCEVRFRDGDSTCGNNCDPQTCTPSLAGLTCSPGPDPGVSTTIFCRSGTTPESALLDCDGDGTPEASCTINGDTLGLLPEFFEGVIPGTPIACSVTNNACTGGANAGMPCSRATQDTDCDRANDPTATCENTDCLMAVPVPGADCVGGFCDFDNTNPLLNTSVIVACAPPGPPFFGSPGATITCTAVTTDGDKDCDKTATVQINCPGLAPCDPGATPPPPDCDDGEQCTADSCNDSSGTALCDNIPVDNGTPCSDAPSGSGLGVCLNGVCDPQGCSVTGCTDDGNECTEPLQCDTSSEFCCATPPCASEGAPDFVPADTACDGTAPNNNGLCDGAGTCVDNCATTDCSDSVECTQDLCDPTGNGGAACPDGGSCCSNPNIPATACQGGTNALEPCADITECPDQGAGTSCAGFLCDAGGGNVGACDGAGVCEFIPVEDYPREERPLVVACTNNVTGDVSILGFTLGVDPGPMSPNLPFTADLDASGAFTEAFLDAAQFVIPGGVRNAALKPPGNPEQGLQAAVATRGTGATGADVILFADLAVLDSRCAATGLACTNEGTFDPPCTDFGPPPAPNNVCQDGWADVPVLDGSPNVTNGCVQPSLGTPVGVCDTDLACTHDGTTVCPSQDAAGNAFCGAISTGSECRPRPCITSTDCVTGTDVCLCDCSTCAALDPAGCRPGDPDVPCTKGDECQANGFCVTGDLVLPLADNTGSYAAGNSGQTALFGWFDNGGSPPLNANGTCQLPAASFPAPVAPIGVRVSAGGLSVAVQCLMCVDSGGADGIATCQSGPTAGNSCFAPFDNSNNVCVGGVDAGQPCSQTSSTACGGGECVNADCGVELDGTTPVLCDPPDLSSPTPDNVLVPFLVPSP